MSTQNPHQQDPSSQSQTGPGSAPSQHNSTSNPARKSTRKSTLSPRTSPIVWGCLILALCAYVLQRTLVPESVNAAYWVTGILFGLGALLLGVGITIVVRNRRGSDDLDGPGGATK